MKNQYVGDVGDFGKYSLLQAFLRAKVKVGVNWYLTENDDSTDGSKTKYLHKEEYRNLNEELFDFLGGIADRNEKSIEDIEKGKVLPKAVFYSKELKPEGTPAERAAIRKAWFDGSMKKLSKCELVYLDPDNGLLVSGDPKMRKAEKYALPNEVEEYFKKGKNVVFYCHRGRRNDAKWIEYKRCMFDRLPEAKPIILTFHRGTQRSYMFLIHETEYEGYRKIVTEFLKKWEGLFTEEALETWAILLNVSRIGRNISGDIRAD